MKISVLIATKDRADQLVRCIDSILKNNYDQEYEVLVLDQSEDNRPRNLLKSLGSKRVVYIKSKVVGKTIALNMGIERAKGEILAFTDDDCIVSKSWLKNITMAMEKNKDVAGVFGNVLPYKPEANVGRYCPAVFLSPATKVFDDTRIVHYISLGMGNNMAFRKHDVQEIGGFCPWLGPGRMALAGEEGELVYRLLLGGKKLASVPKIVVWHNRWLSDMRHELNNSFYTRAVVATCGYYFFDRTSGTHFREMLKNRLRERLKIKISDFWFSAVNTAKELVYVVWEVGNLVLGLLIGLMTRAGELFRQGK
jgi:GT2 family glycosyltransferase